MTVGPSIPMCATCFTSVGNPICIPPASSSSSSSLASDAWFFYLGLGLELFPVEQRKQTNIFMVIPKIWEMYLSPFMRPPFIISYGFWQEEDGGKKTTTQSVHARKNKIKKERFSFSCLNGFFFLFLFTWRHGIMPIWNSNFIQLRLVYFSVFF